MRRITTIGIIGHKQTNKALRRCCLHKLWSCREIDMHDIRLSERHCIEKTTSWQFFCCFSQQNFYGKNPTNATSKTWYPRFYLTAKKSVKANNKTTPKPTIARPSVVSLLVLDVNRHVTDAYVVGDWEGATSPGLAGGKGDYVLSLRSWRYCVGARLKFWRRSRVPKKGSTDEAVLRTQQTSIYKGCHIT